MIANPLRCFSSIVVLMAMAAPMAGWGSKGHAIVADLAWRELSPETREKIQAILNGAPMNTVGSWADAVRPQEEYRWSAPLHYVNLPDDALAYEHERDCPSQGCVVSAIADFAAVLRDEEADEKTRREALMFLIHFVGDLHQPLHAGRGADRGGNDINVMFYGEQWRLHAVWDSGLLDAAEPEWGFADWSGSLAAEIDAMDRAAWLADFNADDLLGTAGRWAYESNRLSLVHAYSVADGESVEDEYVESTRAIVEARLSQGGLRLAAVLEAAFADGEVSIDEASDDSP